MSLLSCMLALVTGPRSGRLSLLRELFRVPNTSPGIRSNKQKVFESTELLNSRRKAQSRMLTQHSLVYRANGTTCLGTGTIDMLVSAVNIDRDQQGCACWRVGSCGVERSRKTAQPRQELEIPKWTSGHPVHCAGHIHLTITIRQMLLHEVNGEIPRKKRYSIAIVSFGTNVRANRASERECINPTKCRLSIVVCSFYRLFVIMIACMQHSSHSSRASSL